MGRINKGTATRLVQQGSSKMELSNSYWDCECKVNYIHPKNQSRCIHCDTNAVDQPDSRLSELQTAWTTIIHCSRCTKELRISNSILKRRQQLIYCQDCRDKRLAYKRSYRYVLYMLKCKEESSNE